MYKYPDPLFWESLSRSDLQVKILTDDQYQDLQERCFKNWLSLEPPTRLLEILSIIRQCWPIHSVLGEYRLMKSVDPMAFQKLRREGRLARNLRFWLEQG